MKGSDRHWRWRWRIRHPGDAGGAGGVFDRLGGPSARRATPIPAYDAARAKTAERRANTVPGDPEATGAAMLALVDAAEPPLRVFFGDVGLPMIRQEYANRLAPSRGCD